MPGQRILRSDKESSSYSDNLNFLRYSVLRLGLFGNEKKQILTVLILSQTQNFPVAVLARLLYFCNQT